MRQRVDSGLDLDFMESLAGAQTPVALNYNVDYRNVVDARFLRVSFERDLAVIQGDSWITRAGLDDAPGRTVARASYFHAAQQECLVEIDGAIAHLILNDRALVARIAAEDDGAAVDALAILRTAMPEVAGDDQEVPVRFWWWQPNVAQEMARMMPAPEWPDISGNYAKSTVPAIDGLMGWRDGPPAGGRLVLWHGAPGTGKTTALRALAWAWRSWAEFQFITDPEEFLRNPSYLLRTISNDRRSSLATSPVDRWRVLVLEDAGEYLAPDAKHVAGQALSRLLNVCDGVLGQATRSLVLVTTNEPVRALHPALSRPGRCLSEVEFAELSRDEIQEWFAARATTPPEASRAPLAELFAHLDGRAGGAQSTGGFGFTDAAAA